MIFEIREGPTAHVEDLVGGNDGCPRADLGGGRTVSRTWQARPRGPEALRLEGASTSRRSCTPTCSRCARCTGPGAGSTRWSSSSGSSSSRRSQRGQDPRRRGRGPALQVSAWRSRAVEFTQRRSPAPAGSTRPSSRSRRCSGCATSGPGRVREGGSSTTTRASRHYRQARLPVACVAAPEWVGVPRAELFFDVEQRVDVTYRITQGRKRSGSARSSSPAPRRRATRAAARAIDLAGRDRRPRGDPPFAVRTSPRATSPTTAAARAPRPDLPLPPAGDPDQVDLEYQVEEGRVVDFQIPGGVDPDNGVSGGVSLGMRNFDITDPPDSIWSLFGGRLHLRQDRLPRRRTAARTSTSRWARRSSYYRVRFLEPDVFRNHLRPISFDVDLLQAGAPVRDPRRGPLHAELRARAQVLPRHLGLGRVPEHAARARRSRERRAARPARPGQSWRSTTSRP